VLAVVRRLRARLGRRGSILFLKGTIAVLYGYGQLIQPVPDKRGLHLLLRAMPLHAWAIAWLIAGGVAFGCAFLGEGRDWPGFTAVWLISIPWSLTYLVSWWPLGDNPRGWITACIFGAFGLVCLTVVGWPEPPRATSMRGEARER
jgi:hypothetical protein